MAYVEDMVEQRDEALARLDELAELDSLSRDQQREFARLETEVKKLGRDIDAKKALQAERDACVAPSYSTNGNHTANIHIDATKPKQDTGFESLGHFLQSVGADRGSHNFHERPALRRFAAQGETLGSTGGFSVPESFAAMVLGDDWADGSTPLLDGATKIPMTTDKTRVPRFADDSHASAPFGITWGVVPESTSFGTHQALSMAAIELQAQKVGAIFAASNEWLSDSHPFFRSQLETAFIKSLRWWIEHQLWNGDGGALPVGVIGADSVVSQAAEAEQAENTVVFENIIKMWSALRPGCHSRAMWVCHPSVLPQLLGLTLTDGATGHLVSILGGGNVAGAPAVSILGRPLHISEHLSTLGTAGDIILCDATLYCVGNRQDIRVDVSPHLRFDFDESVFRTSARICAQPTLSTTQTLADGSTIVGWAVQLADR